MPIYRDPHTGKLKFDGVVAMLCSVMVLLTTCGTSIGAYYAFRAVTSWRLEKCESDNALCRSNIKDVNDRLTNHAMGESGTQARLAAVENTIGKIDTKIDALLPMIPLLKATRESQTKRGY